MNTKAATFFKKADQYRTAIIIGIFFLYTVFMQANPSLAPLSHEYKTGLFVAILLLYLAGCFFMAKTKRLTTDDKVFLLITGGVILRSYYVICTGVVDRQHDEGYFSGLSDDLINPGHLGYIEYLCKFGHLPDFSPYKLFSYYHPPFHHILSCLFIDLQMLFGAGDRLAFENIQALTLLYSSLCLTVGYGILKKMKCSDTCMVLAMALLTFHPGMIYMSASVNNDMLSTLLTFTCFYFALCWMEHKSLKNLILIALSLGFGMITKLNVAVMAFPLAAVFLMHFVKECKAGRVWKSIREFAIFGVLTAGIGLSWVIRNLVFYNTNPGVPILPPESEQYIGKFSYWQIFGLPASMELAYPFHTINGNTICNTWQILFRTSIFDEVRPELSDFLLQCCRAALILAATLGILLFVINILMAIREIRKGNCELGVFLLVGYVLVVLTFIAFIIKYPYTCSANFRYVVVGLLFSVIGLIQFCDRSHMESRVHQICAAILEYLVLAFVILITLVLLTWNQW